ncbi:MAG: PLP-dependent transferase [Planctomycetes bacterium]|nr:PLP-dependent transferase [Planctomycetota bacterium]
MTTTNRTPSDFLPSPAWRIADLGRPLPDDPHAVSVCLPTWQANVGYEEGDPAVTGAMRCGYPRFFLHPTVLRLFAAAESRFAREGECCFVLPSQRVAERCAAFVERHAQVPSRVDSWLGGLAVVTLPAAARTWAKNFWQHAGEIVSSRRAASTLTEIEGGSPPASSRQDAQTKCTIRERIANAVGCHSDDVFLFPSGMAATFAAFRALQRLRPGRRSVQFGFPYVDNLKVLERFGTVGAGVEASQAVQFYPHGAAAEIDRLASLVADEELLGLFCEFPGNPLLRTLDLRRVRDLADRHKFPVLVDDTLGTFVNVDVLPAADVLVSSLTKYFSGAGDVMGGSLVLNRQRPFYAGLRAALLDEFEDLLWFEDAVVLERNSRDFVQRVQRINQTAEQLCHWLRQHPAVGSVYYPQFETPENYRAFLRPGGGYGGLFSIVLREPHRAPAVFDALQISKGPNLGCNFTLCCPFTLLAHYQELEFAERCGISRYLLRVAVGLEEPEWLIEQFSRALAVA